MKKIYYTTKSKFYKYQDSLPKLPYKTFKKIPIQDVSYKDGVLIFFNDDVIIEKAEL